MRPDVCVVSPCWVDLEHGVTLRERAEADVVRAMIERSRRVIAIAPETKLGWTGPYVVADVEQLSALVTDAREHAGRRVRPAGHRAGVPVTARKAMYAVYAVFILNGFMFATWASRIPQVRDGLELNPQRLGLVLLAIAIGSLISMPLAGRRHLPSRRGAHDHGDVDHRRDRAGHGRDRLPVRRRAGRPGPVPARPRQRHVGRRDERRGRRGRAPAGPLDHVALPRGLQRRHGRRRAAGLGDDRARRVGHGPPDRRRRAGRVDGHARGARVPPGRATTTSITRARSAATR